jgi:hypothetical protein
MSEPKIYTTTKWGVRKVTKNFLKSTAEGIAIDDTTPITNIPPNNEHES